MELVRVPSVTGTDAEAELQHTMARWYEEAGLEVDLWSLDLEGLRADPEFPGTEAPRLEGYGVVGTGQGEGRPGLVLQGHVDVVPVGDLAAWPPAGPYSARIVDGTLHGRGACDMKAGVAATLAVARALHRSGVRIDRRLALHSVVSEEDGGLGAFATLRRGHHGDVAVIPEPTSGRLVTANAGALTFRIDVRGRAAHGSTRLEGVSAFDAFWPVAAALRELEERRNRTRTRCSATPGCPYAISVGTVRSGDWAARCRTCSPPRGGWGSSSVRTRPMRERAGGRGRRGVGGGPLAPRPPHRRDVARRPVRLGPAARGHGSPGRWPGRVEALGGARPLRQPRPTAPTCGSTSDRAASRRCSTAPVTFGSRMHPGSRAPGRGRPRRTRPGAARGPSPRRPLRGTHGRPKDLLSPWLRNEDDKGCRGARDDAGVGRMPMAPAAIHRDHLTGRLHQRRRRRVRVGRAFGRAAPRRQQPRAGRSAPTSWDAASTRRWPLWEAVHGDIARAHWVSSPGSVGRRQSSCRSTTARGVATGAHPTRVVLRPGRSRGLEASSVLDVTSAAATLALSAFPCPGSSTTSGLFLAPSSWVAHPEACRTMYPPDLGLLSVDGWGTSSPPPFLVRR